jgi:hypothetical protein
MKKPYLFIAFLWTANLCNAQLHEVGVFFGGSNYVGDLGSPTFVYPTAPAFGFIYKRNKNQRIAYRATITHMKLRKNAHDSKEHILEKFTDLDKSLTEFTAGVEYNFFEYNLDKLGPVATPYFVFELTAFNYSTKPKNENKRGIALPFGIGYKAKLFGKLAYAIETRVRYTMTDDLDDSEYILENNELGFSNSDTKYHNSETNDWYFFTGVSLVYTFGRPPCCSKTSY